MPKVKTNAISGFPVMSRNSLVGMVSINEIEGAALSKESLWDKTIGDICTKKLSRYIQTNPSMCMLFTY